MNNVNMANAMSAMGGVAGVPAMNNGMANMNRGAPINSEPRQQLNTYIYEYFLRNEMYDCARAIIRSDSSLNVLKNSPSRRRDVNGNLLDNGVDPDGLDGDRKDDLDAKRPDDLPAPNLPKDCPESCFLYEWWCLFWDMYNAQRGGAERANVRQYAQHTQQVSRARQEQQQNMLRTMQHPGGVGMNQAQYQQMMMQQQQNRQGGLLNNNDIARKAMQNNRQVTPQQLQMMQQQQQQKQLQMHRDGSDSDNRQRPSTPGTGENPPSPKRMRLDPAFNGQQMQNGRGQLQGVPGQQAGPNNSNLQQPAMLMNGAVNPTALTPAQFQQFQAQNQTGQATKSLQAYTSGLVQHQANQMPNKPMANPGVPQSQGSPMMNQPGGQDNLGTYYNAEMGANGMRAGPGGAPGGAGGGNHALQDYQMQLMLLEQQNKKRLMMARQEQDNMGGMPREGPGGPGGPVGPGPNGQPFQGASPQGGRSGSSPNPNDQMKRGTPQMNAAGIPSPIPEGQNRNSPGGVLNFMPGQMDANMAPHFYKQVNGMDANMGGVLPNGMRPPSSHPGGFNGPMNAQMMGIQNRGQQQAPGQGWQSVPNGAPMIQQPGVPTPQNLGTPQQRAMQPPPAPAVGAPTNGRTQPSSPQQTAAPPTPSQANKSNPKKKADPKSKRNAKKGNTTATPAAEGAAEAATPTPATPITPVHPQSFTKNGQNGAVQNAQSVQQNAAAAPIQQPQPDVNALFPDDGNMFGMGMDFANPNIGPDVLQDFDFDSFLNQDGGDPDAFNFDTSAFTLENGEVGAE